MSGHNVMGQSGPRVAIITRSLQTTAEGRYVKRLYDSLGKDKVALFADVNAGWGADAQTYSMSSKSSLKDIALAAERSAVNIFHFIASQPFFPAALFAEFVQAARARGQRVVVELRDPQITDENLLQCLHLADATLCSNSISTFELIATGISSAKILSLGCLQAENVASEDNRQALTPFGLNNKEQFLLVACARPSDEMLERFVDAAKNVSNGCVVFLPLTSARWSSAWEYTSRDWQELAERHASNANLRFICRNLGAAELTALVGSCNALAFTSGQPHEEAEELLFAAFQQGRAVLAPAEYPFMRHAERVFLLSNRIAPKTALKAFAENADLRRVLGQEGKKWAQSQAFGEFAKALVAFYEQLSIAKQVTAPAAAASLQSNMPAPRVGKRTPRILMQNRPNAYTQPGGDTVVMDRVTEGLRARGIEVTIDTEAKCDPRKYDLVHLFNFALKDQTEALARRCHQAGIPFVVTTMYEDWPIFFNQMMAQFEALATYVGNGQQKASWPELWRKAKSVQPSPIWDNSITANYASALISTGESEAQALRRDYPATKRVEIYHCGGDFSTSNDGGSMFEREYGVRDFVLCVGRFELRKNQLMLLKAFEDSDMTLVFAGGGFSYQPEYLQTCKNFKRRGKTLFLDRLSPEMLASAFQAARVHVLPSWLELPGIVSIEAAWFGRNIVVTGYGTERDYFGDLAFYCSPENPESVYNATMAAFHAPVNPALKAKVSQFTWDRAAQRNIEIYQQVLQGRQDLVWNANVAAVAPVAAPPIKLELEDPEADSRLEQTIQVATFNARRALHSVGMIPAVVGEELDDPKKTEEARKLCDDGDAATANRELREAFSFYQRAATIAPRFARAFRSCGAVALAEGNSEEAERWFEQTLAIDSNDVRALVGLSMIRWERGDKEIAYMDCIRANQLNPDDAVTLLQLVRMSYEMDRLKELEQALRNYLKNDPENIDMLYCLAGCSYKRQRYFFSRGVIERILRLKPDHAGGLELRERIAAEVTGDEVEDADEIRIPEATVNVSVTGRDIIANQIQSLETAKKNRLFDEALVLAEEILADEGLSEEQRCLTSLIKAEISAVRGDLKIAEETFRRYLHHTQWGFRAHAGLGAVCAERGSWLEAQDLFERAIRQCPACDAAIAGLGVCAQQTGDLEKAWTQFEAALQKNPENLRAVFGIVQLGYQLQRLRRTAEVLETYLEMHPVDLSMLYTFAGCNYALQRLDQAEEAARKILIFDPAHGMARELLERIESDRRQGRIVP